jgi:plastocyanin
LEEEILMNRKVLYSLAIISVSMLILFSCAELQKQITLDVGKQENIIEMKVSNFKFEPNNILAHEGDEILFRIRNITISEHNFTLTDPQRSFVSNRWGSLQNHTIFLMKMNK